MHVISKHLLTCFCLSHLCNHHIGLKLDLCITFEYVHSINNDCWITLIFLQKITSNGIGLIQNKVVVVYINHWLIKLIWNNFCDWKGIILILYCRVIRLISAWSSELGPERSKKYASNGKNYGNKKCHPSFHLCRKTIILIQFRVIED